MFFFPVVNKVQCFPLNAVYCYCRKLRMVFIEVLNKSVSYVKVLLISHIAKFYRSCDCIQPLYNFYGVTIQKE